MKNMPYDCHMIRLWNSDLCWVVFVRWTVTLKSVRDRWRLTLVCTCSPPVPGKTVELHMWVTAHWCNDGARNLICNDKSALKCELWHFRKLLSENKLSPLCQISSTGLGGLMIMWGNVPLDIGGLNKNNFICIQVTFL